MYCRRGAEFTEKGTFFMHCHSLCGACLGINFMLLWKKKVGINYSTVSVFRIWIWCVCMESAIMVKMVPIGRWKGSLLYKNVSGKGWYFHMLQISVSGVKFEDLPQDDNIWMYMSSSPWAILLHYIVIFTHHPTPHTHPPHPHLRTK